MNLKKAYKDFFTPRFTIQEIDNAHTRHNASFEIIRLDFEDNKRSLPTNIEGIIESRFGLRNRVNWNQFGECYFHANRMKEFDLIHPEQSEIDSAKAIFVCLIILVITLLFSIIWN